MEHDTSRLDSTRDHGTGEFALNLQASSSMPHAQSAALPIALTELPPVTTKHWFASRKAAVVAAVRDGVLAREEACRRYQLSVEEFSSWQQLVDRHGLLGLRATRLQEYRRPDTGVGAAECPRQKPEPITPAEERQKHINALDWNIDARYCR